MRLSPGVNGAFTHVTCFLAVNEILMLEVLVENSLQPSAEDPELKEGQGDGDGQEGELDAGRRFLNLVSISKP